MGSIGHEQTAATSCVISVQICCHEDLVRNLPNNKADMCSDETVYRHSISSFKGRTTRKSPTLTGDAEAMTIP